MAKRKKRVLPARKEKRHDDSLLVRSAESLGRVIGSLQRQVRGTSRRASSMVDDAMTALPDLPRLESMLGTTTKKSKRKTARTRSTSRKASKKR